MPLLDIVLGIESFNRLITLLNRVRVYPCVDVTSNAVLASCIFVCVCVSAARTPTWSAAASETESRMAVLIPNFYVPFFSPLLPFRGIRVFTTDAQKREESVAAASRSRPHTKRFLCRTRRDSPPEGECEHRLEMGCTSWRKALVLCHSRPTIARDFDLSSSPTRFSLARSEDRGRRARCQKLPSVRRANQALKVTCKIITVHFFFCSVECVRVPMYVCNLL